MTETSDAPIPPVAAEAPEAAEAAGTGRLGRYRVRAGPAANAPARMDAFRAKVEAAFATMKPVLETVAAPPKGDFRKPGERT